MSTELLFMFAGCLLFGSLTLIWIALCLITKLFCTGSLRLTSTRLWLTLKFGFRFMLTALWFTFGFIFTLTVLCCMGGFILQTTALCLIIGLFRPMLIATIDWSKYLFSGRPIDWRSWSITSAVTLAYSLLPIF